MRISDWSSDVCSSDLAGERPRRRAAKPYQHGLTCHLVGGKALMQAPLVLRAAIVLRELGKLAAGGQRQCPAEVGRASCREGVCQYVQISVGSVSLTQQN